ncbi:MAG: hypothetical protein ABTD50_09565 [Polyangiaceae bacterium]|jgi:hypothetical protein
MNRIAQALSSLLLGVAACGGAVADEDESGPGGGSGTYGLDAAVPGSDATLGVSMLVIGEACDVGSVCPNGVECLTGACLSGDCRIGPDCTNTCAEGWCVVLDGSGGAIYLPSIRECVEHPNASAWCNRLIAGAQLDGTDCWVDAAAVCIRIMDSARVTDCQQYPNVGILCMAYSVADAEALLDECPYCRGFPDAGLCVSTCGTPEDQ